MSITVEEKRQFEEELPLASLERCKEIVRLLLDNIEVFGAARYDSEYGDDKICCCGHTYERHFDSYEDMSPVGCKYCGCFEFQLKEDPI